MSDFAVPSRKSAMSTLLARNWWMIALRGVFAIIFGILALLMPVAALWLLVLFYAAYMLADGVFAIAAGLRAAAHHERWGLLVLEGVFDIIAGLIALFLPAFTVLFFTVLLGVWAIASGIALAVAAFRLHRTHGRWLMLLAGVVSVIWGILLLLAPLIGALVLTIWLGAYALIFGVFLLLLAFRLRGHHVRAIFA